MYRIQVHWRKVRSKLYMLNLAAFRGNFEEPGRVCHWNKRR